MKAEEFIKDCTKTCSNETTHHGSYDHTYHEWLTPEQALRAVEIAREELKEQIMNGTQIMFVTSHGTLVPVTPIGDEYKTGDQVKVIIVKEGLIVKENLED